MPAQRTEERVAHVRTERRHNLRLRKRFDEARRLLEPLLGHDPLQHTALYWALHKLQGAFPELKPIELEALVASVVRALTSRSGRK